VCIFFLKKANFCCIINIIKSYLFSIYHIMVKTGTDFDDLIWNRNVIKKLKSKNDNNTTLNDIVNNVKIDQQKVHKFLKDNWYLELDDIFDILEIKKINSYSLHTSWIEKVIKENLKISLINDNKKDIKLMNWEYVNDLFKKNIVIKFDSKNSYLLHNILKSNNFQKITNNNIYYFDEEVILWYLKVIHNKLSDQQIEKILWIFISQLFDIVNWEWIFNKDTTLIFNLNWISPYISKTILRYFNKTTDFSNNFVSKIDKSYDNTYFKLNFIFTTDKNITIEKEVESFLSINSFETIDFESKILWDILYKELHWKIDSNLMKYFNVYSMPHWLISKYAFLFNGNYSFDTLSSFFLSECNIDLWEEEFSSKNIITMKENILNNIKGQNFNINFFLQTFYWYMQTQKFEKPFSAFLAWPSWVWKTYFAKSLAKELWWNFIRKDMWEFTEWHTTSALLWSPAWYVWYWDKTLVDELKEHTHNIILFDEIEKAHPDILKSFYKLLDEWVLTDRKWDTAILKWWHIVLFTSNIFQSIREVEQSLNNYDKNHNTNLKNAFNDEINALHDIEFSDKKYTKDDKDSILATLNSINWYLKTALTIKWIDNAFSNRLSILMLFNNILDKKIMQEIVELEFNKIYENILNNKLKDKYKEVWKNNKSGIIEQLLESNDVQERWWREISNYIANIMNGLVSWETLDLF